MGKIVLWVGVVAFTYIQPGFYVPIQVKNRKSLADTRLTSIGQFGLVRKARPSVPEHLHSGVDIKRPGKNYTNEPIYAITGGVVISKRDDGPYAQLILEHKQESLIFWTAYEHIAGITVQVGQRVTPHEPIARFMNTAELDRYGWQFDHFHFEVLKRKPIKIKPEAANPGRHYVSYSLQGFTEADLKMYFYHPLEFLSERLKNP